MIKLTALPVLCCCGLLLICLALHSFSLPLPQVESPAAITGYIIGDQAEDFTLKNIDGRMVSLSDFKGAKGYIIVFTCNHCPYAEAYEDRLISIANKYQPLGIPVIAINPNAPEMMRSDNFDGIRSRALSKNFPFPYLQDSLQRVYPRFGAQRTPHVFLLDSDYIVRYIGTIDDNAADEKRVKKRYLESAIDAVLEGREPDPTVTKAVGCPIWFYERK
jgi:peroxiredoxin